MKLFLILASIVFLSMIGIVVVQESFATEPCGDFLPQDLFQTYDNIYTAKVVSSTPIQDDHELSEGENPHNVRIKFQLEYLLKGNPHYTFWYVDVPETDYHTMDFWVTGENYYTIGSESFHIETDDGKSGTSSDMCLGLQDFFDYYFEVYEMSPPIIDIESYTTPEINNIIKNEISYNWVNIRNETVSVFGSSIEKLTQREYLSGPLYEAPRIWIS